MPDLFDLLSPDCALRDTDQIAQRYGRNVTALTRHIVGVLLPRSTEEVRSIVVAAAARRIPLYPISTGKNWGLGSKLPVVDGCVVVDLSRMNRIVDVNQSELRATIEPGVTQAQLADYLHAHHPDLTVNLTGSFGATSIAGNVLERGDGIYSRARDLIALEGVLGDGEAFRVGIPERCGAGPDLTGLFCQSNFGIVTGMDIRLLAKPKRRCLWWAVTSDAGLERMVDAYVGLARQRVVGADCVNIGYANRFLQAHSPASPTEWNSYAVVDGAPRVVAAVVEEMRATLAPFCATVGAVAAGEMEDPRSTLPPFLHPAVPQLHGRADIDSLRLIYQLTGTCLPEDERSMDADLTPFGMKSCVFTTSLNGENARRAADVVNAVRVRSGLNIKLSFFGDGRTLVTVHFHSGEPEQVARAEDANMAIWDGLVACGFVPYRVGIDAMERLVDLRPGQFRMIARLKAAMDPNGIIAPGRYSMRKL